MSRKFDVKTVVSAVSGTNIANNFNDVFELYWYVFDDPNITTTGLPLLRKQLLNHLASTYPDLREAEHKPYTRYGVLLQKYGDELEISPINSKVDTTYVDSEKKQGTKKKVKNKL